ncbi:hypothetical protein MJO28_004383 [Puccinia striiformis f. sp. tritici]|uniref:Uncharacterized protein n=1 Tax=Puccinia striiformis f. sp. tritici TaxID=168172 RepID=A0ACC0ENK8_9BASI|nr:hypothetical protein MJO28_004383 [Puccinia striiformis f. sp. tritici]
MPLAKLPSFASSFADSFKVRWPWSNSSNTSHSSDSQSSWASERSNSISQASSSGARRRKSFSPQTFASHSQETSQASSAPYYTRENNGSSGSHTTTSETESFPRTYQESSHTSEGTRRERSDESYGQSFTISSRLKRAILAPTKLQTAIGFIILIIVVASIVIGLVLGLRNVSLQDKLRNRINTIPVRIPNFNESIVGHIKGQPPQRREFFFVIDERLGFPDEVEKAMIVANGQYPGPIIEVNQGDEVVVNVKNNLAQPTSIHWHGLLQAGANFFDGMAGVTECGIPAGEQMAYRLQSGSFTGTTFWKGGYGTQAAEGLTGGLVVHPTHSNTNITYDEDVLVHLSDLYHENSKVLTEKYISADGIGGKAGNEPVPDGGTINGVGQYPHRPNGEIIFPSYHKVIVEKSKSYRLRLVNAGSMAPIIFSVDSHNLTVIEADGVEVEPVTFTGGIQVDVGQRYSVVLHANHEHHEQYWMRATLVADQFKYDNPESKHEILAILAYGEGTEGVPHTEGHNELLEVLDSHRLRPLVPETPPPATQTYSVDYSLGQSSGGSTVGMFNSTIWVPLLPSSSLVTNLGDGKEGPSVPAPYQFLLSADKPEVIDLIINNLSGGSSTFSLSGHQPWIIGSGSGNYHGDRAQVISTPSNMNGSTPNGPSTSSTPNNMMASPLNGSSPGTTSNDLHGNSTATPPAAASNSTTPNAQANHPGSFTPGQTTTPPSRNFSQPKKDQSKNSPQKPQDSRKYGSSSDYSKPRKTSSKNPTATLAPTSSSQPSSSRANIHELEVHEPYKAGYPETWGKYNDQENRKKGGYRSPNKRSNRVKSRRQLPQTDAPVVIRRDTFTVPKDGWVKIRFATDNPGMWLLYDHIQWHLAAGGAMQFSSRKAEWVRVPDEVQKFCSTPEKLMT